MKQNKSKKDKKKEQELAREGESVRKAGAK